MYSKLLTIAITLCLTIGAYAQSPIELAQRANNYFMAKWSDPTTPTNFKKLRPSNLWTRGVYYEGLMALNEVTSEDRYMEYTDKSPYSD
jgi:rhamnogalacturonyl hydrolase YesR